ncbi:MAG: anhydro-N-acetylmuramic acid kinase [Rhodospirillaceae bacterium]|nr:anhydro-N-acetylmuramic acid kinase [Rhodospirillaceae bacterium]
MLTIGLMSGTSLDGIDAAMIESDGERIDRCIGGITIPYNAEFRARLGDCLGQSELSSEISEVERELTDFHVAAVAQLLDSIGVSSSDVGLIGFHGHTLSHNPERRFTWQLGDGARLAKACGIDVIADFRSADVAAGGQGAPLAPAYHRALAAELEAPIVILNLGGVANVTWIGVDGEMMAFDTGPANALLDDWMSARNGVSFDKDGACAASGTVDRAILDRWLDNSFFKRKPPKSLDRNNFDVKAIETLATEDGAATLTSFTVESIGLAIEHFPTPPERWLVTGGGRHNANLMEALGGRIGMLAEPVENVGWNGDLLEAEAFAYLAVRSAKGLPISWPGTTGVDRPLSGGKLFTQLD